MSTRPPSAVELGVSASRGEPRPAERMLNATSRDTNFCPGTLANPLALYWGDEDCT